MRIASTLLTASLLAAPGAASACGGLFCNRDEPVTQAAERVLFAPEGERMHMHVRLTYAGPPQAFGWLLPAPPDVQTDLSSEAVFTLLDRFFTPRFYLRTEFMGDCGWGEDDFDADGVADPAPGGGNEEGGVDVISREAVGPFDRAILAAESVEGLYDWLEANGYQIPRGADATLRPYIEMGMVFVALKLLPGAQARDVVPLRMSFTSPVAAVPMRPTAVAAEPDMGLVVHLLGAHRAVPTNFDHVAINPAGIDWTNGGRNYADVVSQAADEAGGKAFATDYAGPSQAEMMSLPVFDEETLANIRQARSPEQVFVILNAFRDARGRRVNSLRDPDVRRVLLSAVVTPEGLTPEEVLDCWRCDHPGVMIDVGALTARLEAEINVPRRDLNARWEEHPTLTRLFTTMTAHEMDRDPMFDQNPDLDPVSNEHYATQLVFCDDEGRPKWESAIIRVEDGPVFGLEDGENPFAIQRQAGETVRGIGTPGAARIERTFAAGQPELIEDRAGRWLPSDYIDAAGCACDLRADAPSGGWLLLLPALFLRRRRR